MPRKCCLLFSFTFSMIIFYIVATMHPHFNDCSVNIHAFVRCLCWSPKGKQLVVGDLKGVISQYKPDLKLVKSYPPPPDKPTSALINLLWISNYQFAAVYSDTANPSERPGLFATKIFISFCFYLVLSKLFVLPLYCRYYDCKCTQNWNHLHKL